MKITYIRNSEFISLLDTYIRIPDIIHSYKHHTQEQSMVVYIMNCSDYNISKHDFSKLNIFTKHKLFENDLDYHKNLYYHCLS